MSEPTDPIDQMVQRVGEHFVKVLTDVVANANLAVERANLLVSLSPEGRVLVEATEELRAIRRLLERWDALGMPGERPSTDDSPDPQPTEPDDPHTPPTQPAGGCLPPAVDSRPPESGNDPGETGLRGEEPK